jgi:hypothetical protein
MDADRAGSGSSPSAILVTVSLQYVTSEQEKAMYAVVVRERGQADQINTSGQYVQANVLPRARQAPGIVSGFWMTDMAGATLNVMVFESEDAARSALEPVRTAPRPPSMQVEGADVYEVLAHF